MKKAGKKAKRWTRRRIVVASCIAGLIVMVIAGLITWHVIATHDTDINPSEYQAVFLTNGQVYFGKLTPFNGGTFKLTNVFYLQKTSSNQSANPQNAGDDSSDVQLIKLGSEVHGPQDEMVIERAQVLFYENLKPGGNVAQTITKYDAAH